MAKKARYISSRQLLLKQFYRVATDEYGAESKVRVFRVHKLVNLIDPPLGTIMELEEVEKYIDTHKDVKVSIFI